MIILWMNSILWKTKVMYKFFCWWTTVGERWCVCDGAQCGPVLRSEDFSGGRGHEESPGCLSESNRDGGTRSEIPTGPKGLHSWWVQVPLFPHPQQPSPFLPNKIWSFTKEYIKFVRYLNLSKRKEQCLYTSIVLVLWNIFNSII